MLVLVGVWIYLQNRALFGNDVVCFQVKRLGVIDPVDSFRKIFSQLLDDPTLSPEDRSRSSFRNVAFSSKC